MSNSSETEYFIQTRFNFQTEYIFIKDLNIENYLKACAEKILIDFDRTHDIQLYNQQNATIENVRSASFYINLVATPQKLDSELMIPKVNLFSLCHQFC